MGTRQADFADSRALNEPLGDQFNNHDRSDSRSDLFTHTFANSNRANISANSNSRELANCQSDKGMSCKSPYPEFQSQTHINKDGSQVTFDELDRVTKLRDASNRVFAFKYDRNDLTQVSNESGTWNRQKHHGRYSDEWKTDDGARWKGEIRVDEKGYSFRSGNERTIYTSGGTKSVERFGGNDEVVSRHRVDSQGNIADEDLRAGKVRYSAPDGRTAIRDLKENSLLAFDAKGQLSSMRDAAGQKFTFSDYDDRGQPQKLTNGEGTWTRQGNDRWINQQSHKSWYGKVEVDKESGTYSYTDLSGKKVSHSKDGTIVTVDKGITSTIDKNGRKVDNFADGMLVENADGKSHVQFKVEKGVTKSALLDVPGADVDVVYSKGDIFANIHKKDSAVTAMQDGRVVYSLNHNDRNHNQGIPSMQLSAADLAVVERYKAANPGEDLVVMECYDKKAKGSRFQIYAGLDLASATTGDTIKAGQVIGRSGHDGYQYSARRQKLSGVPIELIAKGREIAASK